MNKIEFSRGIVVSQIITKILGQNDELNDFLEKQKNEIYVGALQNGREQGYTYSVVNPKTLKAFTWCTYEHRNSDAIIINGKEGFISDGLPYKGDSAHIYIARFESEEYAKAAKKLAEEIIRFLKVAKKEVKKVK